MNILFIDIASHQPIISCVEDDKIKSIVKLKERIGDKELIPAVENIIKDASWKYKDLTHIACIIGPGGFTSLRIAVSYTNILADQLGILSAGIHLSDLFKARINSKIGSVDKFKSDLEIGNLWIHSTKKNELFVRDFTSSNSQWNEPIHITLLEFQQKMPKHALWCGELIDEHRLIVDKQGYQPMKLQSIEYILPAFLSSIVYEKQILKPWYGREW